MLTVYTYPTSKPTFCIDFSEMPLSELAEAAQSVFQHQKDVHIWLGYLEGWMLNAHEEVLLRPVLRKFACSLVSRFPHSFSHAWKNEIDSIYTSPPHGDSTINHHGRSLHNGCSFEHGPSG